MNFTANLNRGLYKSFMLHFAHELNYYRGNAGMLYWLCERCKEDIRPNERQYFVKEQVEIELKVMERYTKSHYQVSHVSFNGMQNEEIRYLNALCKSLMKYYDMKRMYKGWTINYMMLHLLLKHGYIEVDNYVKIDENNVEKIQEGDDDGDGRRIHWA